MKILIKVTNDVLERSKMCGKSKPTDELLGDGVASNCAIARAVRDVFPRALVCYADTIKDLCDHSILPRVGNEDGILLELEIALPEVASDFIRAFDKSTPEQRVAMQPISFEIEVPQEVIDKIGIEEVTRILSESKTLELVGETIGEN